MPFLAAQSAMPMVTCGRVKEVRRMKGDCSVTAEVAAAITIVGVFDCVASGATAKASGVRPNPARNETLSLTRSSCAMRRVTSGVPVSSLTISSMVLPATLAPFWAM